MFITGASGRLERSEEKMNARRLAVLAGMMVWTLSAVSADTPPPTCQDQECKPEPGTSGFFCQTFVGMWCSMPPDDNSSCNWGVCTATPPTPPPDPIFVGDECLDGQVIPPIDYPDMTENCLGEAH